MPRAPPPRHFAHRCLVNWRLLDHLAASLIRNLLLEYRVTILLQLGDLRAHQIQTVEHSADHNSEQTLDISLAMEQRACFGLAQHLLRSAFDWIPTA
jgi:hypothetical protein